MRSTCFHGAHDPGKVAGAIELRMHPQIRELEYDENRCVKSSAF